MPSVVEVDAYQSRSANLIRVTFGVEQTSRRSAVAVSIPSITLRRSKVMQKMPPASK